MEDKTVWEKYYNVANTMGQYNSEEYLRSAISRYYYYYYSIFGLARFYLTHILGEIKFKKGNRIHLRVMERFKESQNPYEEFVGKTLEKYRLLRNESDYDINFEYTAVDIKNMKRTTKKCLENLNILINNHNPNF